jgi:radical SAM protein with 4Fe4S-binding SPASM domain
MNSDSLITAMNKEDFVIKKSSRSAGLFSKTPPSLTHLDIELTERCNNACMHCYINLPENDVAAKRCELTTEQWKSILQQAADLGALSVRFTGGEPLLREDFTELYLFARRLGMQVFLFTNARLITPKLADLFTKIPPLKKIEVSVYGLQATTYEAVTQTEGSFTEFKRGLNFLLERQIPFVVKSVVLPPNINEIEAYEAWIQTLPGSIKPTYSLFLDLRGRRDSISKNNLIKKWRLSPEKSLAILTRRKEDYFRTMVQFSDKFMRPQRDVLFSCGAGTNGCVDAYGQYQMCMLLRHPDMVYDLTTGTLKEGLLDVFPRLRQAKASNPEYLRRCARCFLKGLCEQCPAKSWMEHGTLDTPVEYLCQVAHAQARFLGLLEDDKLAWKIVDWNERIHKLVQKN